MRVLSKNNEQLKKAEEHLTRIAVVYGHNSPEYNSRAQALEACRKLATAIHEKKRVVRCG